MTCYTLVSCGSQERDATSPTSDIPKDVQIIDREIFPEVLAEAQVIESHGSVLRTMQPYYKDSLMNYYQGMYDKYGITQEDFYYSMKAYSKDPKEMDLIITEAIVFLKNKEAELGDVQPPQQNLSALSRQQIGDIVFETPLKQFMLDAESTMAGFIRDSLFHYLDSFPDIVTSKGYDMESVRFTFILNTNNSMMFNQLKEYLKNKEDKGNGVD